MGLGRLVTRRKGTSLVPVVVLGAAVSLGVVAVSASRFGWRRMKADKPADGESPPPPAGAPETAEPLATAGTPGTSDAPDSSQESRTRETAARPVLRFKPAPPRDPGGPRWDSPPAGLAVAAEARARPDPPAP